jgi:pilus assembly protein Flp/PilA
MLKLWISLQNRVAELRDEEGQAMAEYGLILALIAVFCILALVALGTDVRNTFQSIANAI